MGRMLGLVSAVCFVVVCIAPCGRLAAAEEIFEKPIRLQADGVDIDTGEHRGHCGPALADVDGDGLADLVVGDFSGKFHFYQNVGSQQEPKYTAAGNLQAGDADAEVPIYCCIGSSPFFVDFDDDGKPDFISGSYDPGECYLFRGLGGGKFAKRETLVDKSRQPILRVPNQKQRWESFGSWPVMVDWNGDGRLDLLVGTFEGTLYVRLNEGTREKPEFGVEMIVVQAEGKELKLPGKQPGHAAVAVADWDGDGRWDILSVAQDGGVYFFRNVGEPTAPSFAEPQTLIAPHQGIGYEDLLEPGAEPVPGIRTQIAAVDYRGNGKVDLLVGDFCTTLTPRSDLTADQRQQYDALRKKSAELGQVAGKRMADLRAEVAKRFPGDAAFSEEAQAEWRKAVRALRASNEHKAIERASKEINEQTKPLLAKPARKGNFNEYATTRGYVWLFLRK